MNNNAASKFFIYFSEILGRDVLDFNNRRVGRLSDIAMKMNGEIYPKAATLIVKRGLFKKEYAQIDWNQVKEVGDIVKLNIGPDQISYQDMRPKNDLTLCIDILDQQIVDTHNQKVVRVNDIHLLRVENQLYVAHVDVGIRGLVRRMEWSNFIDGLIHFFRPQSTYLLREDFISWKNAQVLTTLGKTKNLLKVDVAREKLSQMHPTELIEIIRDLGKVEKHSLFRSLDAQQQRKVFSDMPTPEQAELIELMDEKEATALLADIPSDEAADLLLKLPKRKTNHLMKLMETKTSKRLSKLLKFSKDSAGGLMTTEYLYLPQESLVKDALQKIKDSSQFPGSIFYIFLVDQEHHLVGWTSLRWFINTDPETPLIKTCHSQEIFVYTDDKIDKIALLLEKYKFSALPVINKEKVLQGIITIDDVMEELISIAWKQYKEKF